MKNFLQVLLVGTILVSSGDVFTAAVGWGSPATEGLKDTMKQAETAVNAGGLTFGELAHGMGLEIPSAAPTPIEINPDLATLGEAPVVFIPGEDLVIEAPLVKPEAASKLGAGFGAYFDAFLGDFGGSFGNFFDSAVNTVMMPFKLGKGIWDTGAKILSGNTKGMGDAIGDFFSKGFSNMGTNITAGFNSFSAAGKMMMASPADLTKMAQSGMDVFGNTTASIEEFFNIQYDAAGNLTAESQAAVAEKLAGMPAAVSNVAQYPIMILQIVEAGNQDDTTKSVKVKSENALEASQGSSTDSTVGTTLDGTNMASAAVAMATLLKNNPVDLNLLKESDLDLTKDKDQKTLRQRRDLLLQMYAVSAQVIAEGSMAISSDFYDRINALSETLTETTGSLGAASVLNDSERYPYFEMVRQTALSAVQLGLKGAATLPNLQAMHSYHINNNK